MIRTPSLIRVTGAGFLLLLLTGSPALAQSETFDNEGVDQTDAPGWSNDTELSIVVSEGNSNSETFAFKNVLTRKWKRSRLKFTIDGLRADSADDPYLLTDPGQTFLVGEPPTLTASIVTTPSPEPDAEKYFFEGRLTKKTSSSRSWNAGGSWDRNEDAGILNRYIVFGGVGNHWTVGEKFKAETSYGLSVTDREEETPDPEKEDRFAGVRATTNLHYDVRPSTRLEFGLTANLNVEDTSDYALDSTSAVSVSMTKRLSLKVSFQFLYNSEPALEDADVIARLRIVDPDGTPGTGDEFFETVDMSTTAGVFEIEYGSDQLRKQQLDTVFRTSLVINF